MLKSNLLSVLNEVDQCLNKNGSKINMFINEITSTPRFVEGRKFVERTINSKFNKTNVSITTISMNDKPIAKQYTFVTESMIKHFWKSLTSRKVHETRVNKLSVEV